MSTSRTCARRMVTASIQQTRTYSAPAERADPPNKVKYIPTSGSYPKGFFVGSAHAQVKESNTRYDDLALIASEKPCSAALVTTRNAFKAAPVRVSTTLMSASHGKNIKGLVINSGCANAVTGTQGRRDAVKMSLMTDKALAARFPQPSEKSKPAVDIENPQITDHLRSLVMSTGVIGQNLPIDRITAKMPDLVDSLGHSHDHWLRAARAICTTDTFPKLISRQFTLPGYPGVTFSMAGMTKGAGMIAPNMATLLGAICTDAPVHPLALKSLLTKGTRTSFNAITIDGDTSTNDSIAIFANGMAAPEGSNQVTVDMPPTMARKGGKDSRLSETMPEELSKTKLRRQQTPDYNALSKVVNEFMQDLAKLVVRDGEGATKFVTIRVEKAINHRTAMTIAKTIANSALVKTALYGKDANWGRILCAIGYAPSDASRGNGIKPNQTSVSFIPSDGSEELKLLVNGEPQVVDETRAKAILEFEDLEIKVTLSNGHEQKVSSAVVYTCDFSHEYVTINGDYRT